MSKVCKNCQANNNDEARYCTNCGNSLKQVEQSQEKTEEELIILANQGDIEAQAILGDIYSNKEHYTEAFKCYRKAAEQGLAMAQNNLGFMYCEGLGTQQNYYEAYQWFQKAAEQGLAEAQYNLAFMYEQGKGIQQDYNKAMEWFQKAAKQGYSDAQQNVELLKLVLKYSKNREYINQYENEVNETKQEVKKSNNKSGCFIATAVYNSPTAPKVMILKEFRDQKLLTTSLGTSFVKFYYKHSPAIANFLSKHKLLSEVVRIVFIEPLVWMVRILVVLKM